MDRHSRWVQFLKVLLPLTAITLLSTVFLLSRSVDTNLSVPFTREAIDDRLSNQAITRPNYKGVTNKGEEVQVQAQRATQGAEGSDPSASELEGRYKLNSGGIITLDSDTGTIQPDKSTATFVGNVVIRTADGLEVTTEVLNTALDEIRGDAPGLIEGTGPIGDFSAGRMRFGSEKNDGAVHILFTDGVKLIYEPKKAER